MPPTTSPSQIVEVDAVRTRTLDLLDQLAEAAGEMALPAPPDFSTVSRDRLRENRYTVLVAGEAKRGKTTFVNAILGRPLLPTDVDVATCQVFRVRQEDEEGYRIRYEDDSAEEIESTDLPRFGSQVHVDAGEAVCLEKPIRWIEVEGPVRFLPREITLLDTPGLGSLYADHARITQRFVPLADAVIFVLSSDSPIGLEEVSFLDEILAVTPSVFVIQTMIDRYKREHWQAIQVRNQQILSEQFGKRLTDSRVWPVSSINLLRSAQSEDADYEMVSKFRPLASALHRFLFRVAGWARAAEAVVVAREYYRMTAALLVSRKVALLEQSATEREARQASIAERRRRFEADWGQQGQQRKALLEAVQKETRLGEQEFRQTLGQGGPLHDRILGRINALRSLEEAEALARRISDEVIRDAAAAWRDVCRRTNEHCVQLLTPFLSEAASGLILAPEQVPISTNSGPKPILERDHYAHLQTAVREGGFALGTVVVASNIAFAVSTTLAASALFPPLAAVAALGAGVYGLLRGFNLASGRQLTDAKRQIESHVRDLLRLTHQEYFHVDQRGGRFAVVEEYFSRLVADVTAHIERVTSQKSEEARAELGRLAEDVKLNEHQRQAKVEQLARQSAGWARLGEEADALANELNRLDRSFLDDGAAGSPQTPGG